MYIYHALINALSAHMIHINLNIIFLMLGGVRGVLLTFCCCCLLQHATCEFYALFFDASACICLMVLSELLVCMNDSAKLCFTVMCISTYCNFMQSIDTFLRPHTWAVKSLCSVGQVKNELTIPVEVQYRGDTKLETCGMAQPGKYLSLPLNAVYALSSELFFKPVGNRLAPSFLSFLTLFHEFAAHRCLRPLLQALLQTDRNRLAPSFLSFLTLFHEFAAHRCLRPLLQALLQTDRNRLEPSCVFLTPSLPRPVKFPG